VTDRASPLDPVRAYLAAPRLAVLSTLDAAGAPHQAVVHYWLAGGSILVNGRADRRWVVNLCRDPRISLVIADADRPLHWVGVKGHAEPAAQGDAAVEDAMALARRYGEDPESFRGQERVSLRVLPRRVYEYGG
jgi:PPOX class probable F420-dependent enzyme